MTSLLEIFTSEEDLFELIKDINIEDVEERSIKEAILPIAIAFFMKHYNYLDSDEVDILENNFPMSNFTNFREYIINGTLHNIKPEETNEFLRNRILELETNNQQIQDSYIKLQEKLKVKEQELEELKSKDLKRIEQTNDILNSLPENAKSKIESLKKKQDEALAKYEASRAANKFTHH